MTLVARRDPHFHPGAHDGLLSGGGAAAGPHVAGVVPSFARLVSVLQIVGSLLAVPLGVASGYSIYRANFSVETTCQGLRANIIGMLDKSVDASRLRMLVRRDVEAFEHTCGAVDPDATAAFNALLAADKTAAPVATAVARRAQARPGEVAHKVELRADAGARQQAVTTTAAAVEAAAVKRAASASDAVWLAAVRRALLAHVAEPAPPADADAATTAALTPAVVRPPAREAHSLGALPAPPPTIAAPMSAPALPPATAVAIAPVPQADADHPVPPASIPAMASVPKQAATRSRFGELVAQIPLVGWAFER